MSPEIRKAARDPRLAHANTAARTVLLLVVGNLALIAAAKFTVPFWPVPLTLETFAVLLIAATYRWRLATATVALFLFEGAAGFPVFASGGGLPYFLGPTGGYLAGYLLATVLVAYLADHGWRKGHMRLAAAMLLGEAVILGVGYMWLGALVGYHDALLKGVLPFIFGDLLKIALATSTVAIGQEVVKTRLFRDRMGH